jgi:hypothetical protein
LELNPHLATLSVVMVLGFGWVAMADSLLSGMVMIGMGFCCLGQGHQQSTGSQHAQGDQTNG